MVDNSDGLKVAWKPGFVACPHLSFDGIQARCIVHDRPEFRGSPCWIYGNSDVDPDFLHKRGKPCPVGTSYLANGGLCKLRPKAADPAKIEDLEIFGSWEPLPV